jgi:uncharacterized membrane protein YgcG
MSNQHTQPQHQPTRHRARRVVQQHQPQRKTKAKPSFWARLIKFAVVAFLAYALVPMSWLHAAEADSWSVTIAGVPMICTPYVGDYLHICEGVDKSGKRVSVFMVAAREVKS